MKNVFATVLGLICITASVAHATPTFHCVGNKDGMSVEIEFYQGYGYDATYAYFKNNAVVSSGYAHGGSYSECGSRTNPCKVISITEYDIQDLKMNFSMISQAGAKKANGSLAIYGNGYATSPTEVTSVECDIDESL
jgi:hypothetical protein